jgi:cytochrome c-type biogenesis protein CcmE
MENKHDTLALHRSGLWRFCRLDALGFSDAATGPWPKHSPYAAQTAQAFPMNPVRKRRLMLVALVLLAAAAAATFVALALQENMNYLYSPSEVRQGKAPKESRFRIGGVVCTGSVLRTTGTLDVMFKVTDEKRHVPVHFNRILPDMFKEGTSVIATGKMQGQKFVADEVLAKHDETYMPAEVAKTMTPEMQAKMSQGPAQHRIDCGAP